MFVIIIDFNVIVIINLYKGLQPNRVWNLNFLDVENQNLIKNTVFLGI